MPKLLLIFTALVCTNLTHAESQSLGDAESQKTLVLSLVDIGGDRTPDSLYREILQGAEDPEVDGILLVINHHGGSIGPFGAVADAIRATTERKPVVALVFGTAASMGYVMAAASDYIVCHSMDFVGNIGLFWTAFRDFDLCRTDRKEGIESKRLVVKEYFAGRFKHAFSNFGEISHDAESHLQGLIEAAYQDLLDHIARDRNLSLDDSDQWAEGRLFTASRALELGLVDEIGTILDVPAAFAKVLDRKHPDQGWDTAKIMISWVRLATSQESQNKSD